MSLEQHKFLEDDPKKSCVDYTETASYNHCDQKYIRTKFKEQFSPNFIPVWLTKNYSQVTTHFVHSPYFYEEYSGIVDGSEDSGFYHNDKVGNESYDQSVLCLSIPGRKMSIWYNFRRTTLSWEYKYLKYSFLLDCAEPCLQTYTKAVFIEETKILKVPGYSKIDIVFSPVVKMFLNDFQPFSFASFLASVGGALGLWLGLGVQQIIDSLFMFMQSIKIVQ